MKVRTEKLKVAAFLLFCAAALLLYGSSALAELTINANHDHINIDFFYNGSTVSVSGVSDPDVYLIVKISSADGHEVLKQKGKVAGILWMNVGTLEFKEAPNFYSVHCTKNIEDLLDKGEADKYVLGYSALERHVEIIPASKEEEKDRWFNEFVKYKESSKLYACSVGRLSAQSKGAKGLYYIKLDWPYQAAPGDYIVNVYAVKNKKVIEKAETKVFVEQVGIVKRLSEMAKNNGAIYGIISILAALGAGFGVGLIFRKGGGSH